MTEQKAELKKSGDILKHFGKILNAKTEDTTTEDQQIPEGTQFKDGEGF